MAVKRKKKRSKFAPTRHPFLYHLENANGEIETRRAWAKVVKAKKPVTLTLTEEHVARSIELEGVGSTQKCPMAVCTYNHAREFPHPVCGAVDWTYTRAFVASKKDKHGLPCECVVYEHNGDGELVARLNDTARGNERLLEKVRREGALTIELHPYRVRSKAGRPGQGRRVTGARSPERRLRGAKLRYAMAIRNGALPSPRMMGLMV